MILKMDKEFIVQTEKNDYYLIVYKKDLFPYLNIMFNPRFSCQQLIGKSMDIHGYRRDIRGAVLKFGGKISPFIDGTVVGTSLTLEDQLDGETYITDAIVKIYEGGPIK